MTQTSGKSVQAGTTIRPQDTRKDVGWPGSTFGWLVRLLDLPTWVWCLIIGGVALGFGLYRLGDPSIWYDEAFSVELARQPLPLLWHIIWGPEPNMELYFLFLHFWLGLTSFLGFSPTEFMVRFPSAVFAALSAVVVFLLGKRYFGLTAGIVAAGLYLLNNLQLVYAQQTRSYSLELLLVCIGWYALLAAITGESHRKWWVCYVVSMVLAVYAHLFSLLLLGAQLVAVAGFLILPGVWRSRAWRRLPALIGSLVAFGLLIVPMILVSRQGSKTGWLPIPHRSDVIYLILTISDDSKPYFYLIAAFCCIALAVGALVYLPLGKRLLERFAFKSGDEERWSQLQRLLPLGFALVCWVVVPAVVSYVVSKGPTRIFSPRYLVPIVPGVFLLVGLGVAVFRWRVVQAILGLGMLLLALHYVPLYYASAQVEDWNSTVHWLEQQYHAGDGLVCYNNAQGCQIPVEYYFHAYPTSAHFTDDSPGAFSWETYGPADASSGYEAAVNPQALAVYAAKHPRLFYIKGRVANETEAGKVRAAVAWLDSHYHLVNKVVTPTVTIWLYDKA